MTKKVQGGEVQFKATAQGLDKVANDAKKAGTGFNTLDKNARSADRGMKGASNMSSNATKNFSKLSQGITGGLVPAYATLAANLFALDAVFRFLKDAGDFRVLKEGQLAFAAATGVAYESLARDIQAATRNMINFRDAAQAGAIGRAAGLSAGQLNQLSEAAFKVSVALGRDVTDSFNRLVRGVTKAEPELLDELGIVLRLEEATTKYAAALGLNKNQLSIYQKSQAVVNEVLDQTERKFGKIDAIMNPTANSIAQLGIAFEEVIDRIKEFIAPFAEGIGKFMTNNIDVITVAILGFGTGIINSVIPSVDSLRAAQLAQTEEHKRKTKELEIQYDALIAKKKALAGVPVGQANFAHATGQAGMVFGGETGRRLAAGEALSGQQVGNLKSQLSRGVGAFKGIEKNSAEFTKYEKLLNDMKKNNGVVTKKMALQYEELRIGFNRNMLGMRKGFMAFSNVVQTGTRAIIGAFSTISSLIAIGSLLYVGFKALMEFFSAEDTKRVTKYNEKLKETTESQARFNKELNKMVEVSERGLIQGMAEEIQHTGEAVASADLMGSLAAFKRMEEDAALNKEGFEELRTEFGFTLSKLEDLDDRFAKFNTELRTTGTISGETRDELAGLVAKIAEANAAVKNLTETEGELIKAENRLIQSLPKIPYQDIIELLESREISQEKLISLEYDYNKALTLTRAELDVYNILMEQQLETSRKQLQVKKDLQFGSLFNTREETRQLQLEEKRLGIEQTLNSMNEIQVQLSAAGLDLESAKGRALQRQLDLKTQQLAVDTQAYDMLRLTTDEGYKLVEALYEGVEKDLSTAISKGLRGDSSGFEDIGKNFAKTITDAIGDKLAEQFMEDVFKDMLGIEDVRDKIQFAADYHAASVLAAIKTGADAHSSLLGVKIKSEGYTGKDSHAGAVQDVMSTENKNLQDTLLALATAERDYLQEQNRIERESLGQLGTEIEGLKLLSTEKGIDSIVANSMAGAGTTSASYGRDTYNYTGISKDLQDLALSNLDIGDQTEFSKTFANMERLLGLQAAGMLDMQGTGPDSIVAFRNSKEKAARLLDKGLGINQASAGNMTNINPNAALASGMSFFVPTDKAEEIYNVLKQKYMSDIEDNKLERDSKMAEFDRRSQSLRGNEIIEGQMSTKVDTLTAMSDVPSTLPTNAQGEGGGGILNEDGSLNVDYIKSFGQNFDELFEEFKKAKEKAKDENESTTDKFSKNLNQFSGVIGMMGALTGEEEKTAKIMARVAQIQLMIAMYERAKMAFEEGGGGILKTLGAFMFGPAGRQGGIMNSPGYRSFSDGGVSKGPNSGYGAILHGTEAVVPLPNGRSIPVDIGKGKMSTNNTNITVNIDDSGSSTQVDAEGSAQLANAINAAVQDRLEKEMRPGGLLGA